MIHSSKGSVLDDLSKDGKSVAELKQRVLWVWVAQKSLELPNY